MMAPATTTTENMGLKLTKTTHRTKGKYDNSKKRSSDNNQKTTFVGDTPEMLGHVFQVHSEQRKRGQFQDTLDQLKIYTSTNYKKEIKHMRRLFTEIQTPQMSKPKPPRVAKRKTVKMGVTTRGQRQSTDVIATSTEHEGSDNNIEAAIYAEEVKIYVKEKRNTEGSTGVFVQHCLGTM